MTADVISLEKAQQLATPLDTCDLLVAYLEQIGVDYLFGIPGGAIEPLYNALARSERRNSTSVVIARHETGAAFMAEGYARNSGKLGVCCSTTGPGATNMITGVASAYENCTPMLVITPQTSQAKFGKKAMQESGDTGVNVVGMFQFCTRYNSLVSHVDQFEQKLVSAIMTAMSPPYGPAHLSIPADIMKSVLPFSQPSYDLREALAQPMLQDELAVSRLCDALKESKKTVFVVGVGTKEAAGLIIDVACRLNAQILATPDGKSFVNPFHPLFKGVIGFAGHESAQEVLKDPEVDTIVAVGTTLGEFTSNAWDEATLLNNRLIHVEYSESNFVRSPMAKLHVRGQITTVFEKVLEYLAAQGINSAPDSVSDDRLQALLENAKHDESDFNEMAHFSLDEPKKTFDKSTPIKPQWLMSQLTKLFPVNTRYLADTGNNLAWAIHYLNPFDRRVSQRRITARADQGRRHKHNGLFQVCAEFCSMGWSVGNAIGAALANPGEPVLCIIGDGSFLMYGNEITVALQQKLPVIFLVMNDSHLGMVKHGQQLNQSESIGHDLPPINYAKMAEAMGVAGYRIETPEDLLEVNVDAICKKEGPTLIDVIIDSEEVPPMATRIKGMK